MNTTTSEMLSFEELNARISYVSHEIRNCLSVCDMYSQIIKKNIEKENITNNSIDNAIECIQKSIQIINTNLMDLKSLNNNSPKIVDFKTIIELCANLGKSYIDDKNIEYEVFIKNTGLLNIDENRFAACLVNIIKNGIEAIKVAGKIEILAEVKNEIGIIKISNSGQPISKSQQEKIFEKGMTCKSNGCGFGLFLCRNYLQSQNGNIKLTKSTKTKTTFEITIPMNA